MRFDFIFVDVANAEIIFKKLQSLTSVKDEVKTSNKKHTSIERFYFYTVQVRIFKKKEV
jgi:hypothetical protein